MGSFYFKIVAKMDVGTFYIRKMACGAEINSQ